MNYDDALAYLDEPRRLRQDRRGSRRRRSIASTALSTAMGDPQLPYPVIHVTGTNGKGSTAQMITRLLMAQRPHASARTPARTSSGSTNASAATASRSATRTSAEQIAAIADLEGIIGVAPELLRDRHGCRVPLVRRRRHRRRPSSRSGCSAGGTPPTSSTPGRRRHQHRHGPQRVRRPDARRTSPARRRASSSPAPPS